jgi:Zn-dependent metalloprotease
MVTRKSLPKKRTTGKTVRPVKRARPSGNGLKSFAMNALDQEAEPLFQKLTQERATAPAFSLISPKNLTQIDPETIAKRYLQQAFDSKSVPALTAPKSDSGDATEFSSLGVETIPLTASKTVKFRQTFNKIPIYGSLVTVELDEANQLLGINSSIGDPTDVSSVAKVSPAQAIAAVQAYAGFKKTLTNIVPHLNYYYDQQDSRWRLAFILEDVPVTREAKADSSLAPRYMDYIVDAHTGRVIIELPRTPSVAAETVTALDGKNASRQIRVDQSGNASTLKDSKLNIQTFDFKFDDPSANEKALPGKPIVNPPNPWPPAAVSAHANATAVADFLRTVLRRNNIDNKGGPMNSSINCVVARESPGQNQWFNAYWNGHQMVYGQRLDGNSLMSLSVDLDVVGHEMFHGVTDSTARLEYAFQSGALNESYSDIFGIIIANFDNPNTLTWNWKVGEGLDADGKPFRDMANPTAFGQPDHMKNYKQLPNTENGDYGGVHTNSGIHNKAAYNVLTATAASQIVLFKPSEVAAIFYIALTQYLSRTSQFSDSKRGAITATRSLFRTLPTADLQARVDAIEKAFTDVGIS